MARQGVRAVGGEAGVAHRGAGGTGRARVSSDERDKRGNKKNKKAGEPEGQGRAGGGESGGPRRAQRYTSSCAEKRHPDEPH